MERVSRILLFLALFGGMYFLFGSSSGTTKERQPIVPRAFVLPAGEQPPAQRCDLWTPDVHGVVSTNGGALTDLEPLRGKYRGKTKQTDFVTTPDHPQLGPLYVGLRGATGGATKWLAQTDLQDFRIVENSARKCVLAFEDEELALEKTFTAGASPYALDLTVRLRNKSGEPRSYALSASTGSYLRDKAVASAMFRMNPAASHVECVGAGGKVKRMLPDAFEAEDFQDREVFPIGTLNAGDWAEPQGPAVLAAISSAYFTNSIAHSGGPALPTCQLQIEERWDAARYTEKKADPNGAGISTLCENSLPAPPTRIRSAPSSAPRSARRWPPPAIGLIR
jgi:hypothetical protein